ncbi:MAG: tRNA (adenosine(37)-N6)-dimethylallyltransferase MiaA [Betaproteobacteria bacterium]|nr:tRNA (adenosine(37)-N6)-dimethylallyltransferase MiaA [Betaproteobacteria bacterium]
MPSRRPAPAPSSRPAEPVTPVTSHQSPVTGAEPQAASRAKWPPAILLMGPTASGKTAVAARLAQSLPCEIISVDSAQVYKGMDIGTAKPEAALLEQAPHHLLDIIEPHESYSAARFRDDALALMREITERDRIPLLAGGTMLYFRALTEGLNELPEADPMIRLMIDTMAEEGGWPAVHARLKRVDPETAARLEPTDAQRIQRALEIYLITNQPMSVLLQKPKYVYFPYTPIRISLVPSDREVLHMRIARRFDAMLEAGLVEELRKLREEYALETEMPSMRCVGYRQAWEHLEGRIGLGELREQGVAATRQLAKRQLTWLRAMENVTEFDCLSEDLAEMVLEYVRRELEAQLVGG